MKENDILGKAMTSVLFALDCMTDDHVFVLLEGTRYYNQLRESLFPTDLRISITDKSILNANVESMFPGFIDSSIIFDRYVGQVYSSGTDGDWLEGLY